MSITANTLNKPAYVDFTKLTRPPVLNSTMHISQHYEHPSYSVSEVSSKPFQTFGTSAFPRLVKSEPFEGAEKRYVWLSRTRDLQRRQVTPDGIPIYGRNIPLEVDTAMRRHGPHAGTYAGEPMDIDEESVVREDMNSRFAEMNLNRGVGTKREADAAHEMRQQRMFDAMYEAKYNEHEDEALAERAAPTTVDSMEPIDVDTIIQRAHERHRPVLRAVDRSSRDLPIQQRNALFLLIDQLYDLNRDTRMTSADQVINAVNGTMYATGYLWQSMRELKRLQGENTFNHTVLAIMKTLLSQMMDFPLSDGLIPAMSEDDMTDYREEMAGMMWEFRRYVEMIEDGEMIFDAQGLVHPEFERLLNSIAGHAKEVRDVMVKTGQFENSLQTLDQFQQTFTYPKYIDQSFGVRRTDYETISRPNPTVPSLPPNIEITSPPSLESPGTISMRSGNTRANGQAYSKIGETIQSLALQETAAQSASTTQIPGTSVSFDDKKEAPDVLSTKNRKRVDKLYLMITQSTSGSLVRLFTFLINTLFQGKPTLSGIKAKLSKPSTFERNLIISIAYALTDAFVAHEGAKLPSKAYMDLKDRLMRLTEMHANFGGQDDSSAIRLHAQDVAADVYGAKSTDIDDIKN